MTSNNLQNLSYGYDKFGNLAFRKDETRNLEEHFEYDHLNRLKVIKRGMLITGTMEYDPYGRMTKKVSDNTIIFSDARYDINTKPHAIDEATCRFGIIPEEEQNITYTCFDKVKTITEGDNTLAYTYGYDRQRIFMEEHANGIDRTKRYVGSCEFITKTENNVTTASTLTYLTSPTGVFAVVVTNADGKHYLHYILKDHLGSWSTITDSEGVVEQELSFDAWGNLRDPNTWLRNWYNPALEEPMFDRGYTGHEHIPAFGLINMNGRCYDPMISSFLSVDAFVDEPTSAQGFNRYAYCMYNPLKYVDPSGWQKVGGMRPRNEFHDDWSNSHVQPVYEPSDFRNAYYLVNQALYGEDVMGGCGYGEAFQAGMEFYQGASPGSVWSLSHLINNYDNYPSVLNRRDLIEAGVCDYTYSAWWSAEGQGGYQFNISLNHGNYYYENNNYYYGNKGYADVTIGGLDLSRVSNVINVAGLYTTIEGALHFSKPLGIFMDKRGEIRHFIGQPNKNLRKKMNYGKTMNNRFTTAGRVLGGVGVVLSVIQFNQYESDEEKIMCAFDIMIGSAGVVAPQYFGAFSTFWFLGGRQISKWYGEKVITPMIEEGVNPGLMIYQPFK